MTLCLASSRIVVPLFSWDLSSDLSINEIDGEIHRQFLHEHLFSFVLVGSIPIFAESAEELYRENKELLLFSLEQRFPQRKRKS